MRTDRFEMRPDPDFSFWKVALALTLIILAYAWTELKDTEAAEELAKLLNALPGR